MTGFVTKKISTRKKTLGSILKAARTKTNATIEQVEAETRICAKYVLALEAGDYSQLPAEAYNIGFVRKYAEFLKLNPNKIIALYREERSQKRLNDPANSTRISPRRVGDWNFLVTPKLIGIVGMLLLFGGISFYIVAQVRKFAAPPALAITNVPEEFTSDRDTVNLAGKTAEGATVFMNTEPILVNADGSFSQDVQLSPGVNQIVILSRNRAQKESREIVKVLYQQDFAKAQTGNVAN
jgi:cytoskeletal protein RodZ